MSPTSTLLKSSNDLGWSTLFLTGRVELKRFHNVWVLNNLSRKLGQRSQRGRKDVVRLRCRG
jgi:hypothetical protein